MKRGNEQMNEIAKIETEIEVITIAKELQGWVEERNSRLAYLISRGEYKPNDKELVMLDEMIEQVETTYEMAMQYLNSF